MRKIIVIAGAALAVAAPAQAANTLSADAVNAFPGSRVTAAPITTAQFGAVNDAGTIRTQQITVTRPFDRHTPILFRMLAQKAVLTTVRLHLQPANSANRMTWCFENLLVTSSELTETGEKLTFRAPTTYALFGADAIGQNAFSAGYAGGKTC